MFLFECLFNKLKFEITLQQICCDVCGLARSHEVVEMFEAIVSNLMLAVLGAVALDFRKWISGRMEHTPVMDSRRACNRCNRTGIKPQRAIRNLEI